MLNILIPQAGKSNLITEEQYPFPKPLIEINNKTIIERVIENISNIDQEIMFIFILNDEDCSKYHLDSTLNMITNGNCKIIKLKSQTKGSACSSIMAIDYIDNDIDTDIDIGIDTDTNILYTNNTTAAAAADGSIEIDIYMDTKTNL